MFLSIIVPIYNTPEQYLRECLDSCFDQNVSADDYQVICVDDGSTVDVSTLLREYKSKHSNLTVISQNNKGLSGARNTGITSANGDYLWFVDSDDYIKRNCLLELKNKVIEANVDRLCLGAYHFSNNIEDIEALRPNHAIRSVYATRSLYFRQFLSHNNLKFREEIPCLGEDMIFNFEIDQITHSEKNIDEVFYLYRIHGNSITHTSEKLKYYDKFIFYHLRGCQIVRDYYEKDILQKFETIRYLHADIAQIMIFDAYLPFEKREEYLQQIICEKLIPYRRWNNKSKAINVYTNVHSLNLNIICNVSRIRAFSWLLILWAKVWSSAPKKKIEKKKKKKMR